MSGAATHKSLWMRLVQLIAFVAAGGVLWAANRLVPGFEGPANIVTSVGFLLLGGLLLSEILEVVGLPHLTGYLLMGLLAGPYVLAQVEHETVAKLDVVNELALTLIALAGGVELRLEVLKASLGSLVRSSIGQTVVLLIGMTAVFYAVSSQLEFLGGQTTAQVLAAGVLWAVLSISRSPSATLAILSQTRAKGPLARFSLAFVMSSDVLVILLVALVLTFVRPIFDSAHEVSVAGLVVLGHEIVGSVTLGTSLGLLLILYVRFVGGQVLLILLALAYVAGEGLHYLRFDPMLTFLIAGFVVQNFSKQGQALLNAVENMGSVVFILFFATAGAHLEIPVLVSQWAVALILCGGRIALTLAAHLLSSDRTHDPPAVRRWGWSPMLSQAGLTLGLAVVIERTLPGIGAGMRSLVIATVAVNEVVGPIVFKLALARAAEIPAAGSDPEPTTEPASTAAPLVEKDSAGMAKLSD